MTVLQIKKSLTELKEKSDALCKQIEELKMQIFQFTEMTTATKINYDEIYNPDNYDNPNHITFGNDDIANPIVVKLNESFENYNDFINNRFKQNSSALIDLSDKKIGEEEVPWTWAKRNFYRVPLTCILRNLNQLQIEIRLIESNCMR